MASSRGKNAFVCGSLTLAAALAVGLSADSARAADAPATQPMPATQPTPGGDEASRIRSAVIRLGADDFPTREQAAGTLWSLGDKAIPALRAAAESDDPEVARRARGLLDNFTFGVRPDTPKAVIDLLEQYRAGDGRQKMEALAGLAGYGSNGARVLLKIVREEKDAAAQSAARSALTNVARTAAAELIAEGDLGMADQILTACAGEDESSARDYAAFLLLHGGIDEEIRRLRTIDHANPAPAPAAAIVPARPNNAAPNAPTLTEPQMVAMRLLFLERARGDLAAARTYTERAGGAEIADPLLVEQGDWKGLATAIDQRGVNAALVQDLGLAAAYHRLAGDAPSTDRWTAKLLGYGLENANEHWDAAEALLLNDRPAEAMKVLLKHSDYLNALLFSEPLLQFRESVDLYEKAKRDAVADLTSIRVRVTPSLHFMGRSKEARELLAAVAKGEYGVPDMALWLQIIETAREINVPPAQIDSYCVAMLSLAQGVPQFITEPFERTGFDRPDLAARWWTEYRSRPGGETPTDLFARLRRLDRKEWTDAEFSSMADDMKSRTAGLAPSERDPRVMLAADTLAAMGRPALAIKAFEGLLLQSESAPAYTDLADLYASDHQWDAAARYYAKASERDPSDATAVLLRGWALVHAGQEKEGRARMEAAHVMPLGNEETRKALADLLSRRNDPLLKTEADRERELIVKTGAVSSWEWNDSERRLADSLSAKGDALAAAAMWERAFLSNLSSHTGFMDPSANLTIPVLIHRVRAVGLVKAGKIEPAMAEAALCFENFPSDADGQIAIVNALDESGAKTQADFVYDRAAKRYNALRTEFPQSGPANNLIAWLQSRCNRDLNDAVANAKRGIELEPNSTATIDTLSEAYFARGEFDAALEINAQLLKLEPTAEHNLKNRERFMAAKEKASKPEAGS